MSLFCFQIGLFFSLLCLVLFVEIHATFVCSINEWNNWKRFVGYSTGPSFIQGSYNDRDEEILGVGAVCNQDVASEGFTVVRNYEVPECGFVEVDDFISMSKTGKEFELNIPCDVQNTIKRIPAITGINVTLPIALVLLDKEHFDTLSKARKAIRKGTVLLEKAGTNDCHSKRGKGDMRVGPKDKIYIQALHPKGAYGGMTYARPAIDIPILYEDDYIAVVNKPAGYPIFANRESGHRRLTIEAALPFVLSPPKGDHIVDALLYPQPAHRLDKPTSGLLLIAKTKEAIVNLSEQFSSRKVKKSYSAIINGSVKNLTSLFVTVNGSEAKNQGAFIEGEEEESSSWFLIENELDEKLAVTFWRVTNETQSLKATDNTLSCVDLKLKTGRKHQLRRHMAQVVGRHIVGDKTYDECNESAMNFRKSGLFLCSRKVLFEHPIYNTPNGIKLWNSCDREQILNNEDSRKCVFVKIQEDGIEKIIVQVSLEYPTKFTALLDREAVRFDKFQDTIS